jgi:hypothetical protein
MLNLVVLAVGAETTKAAATGVSAAATQLDAATGTGAERTGPPCPDVMVIAARGSGEAPQDNWSDHTAYPADANKGAGVPVYATYQRLQKANPNIQFALEPVVYKAPPVSELKSNPNDYLQWPLAGAKTALQAIQNTESFCGNGVRYVLLGYSSGAWLIHILLHKLPNSLFNKVVGVGLYGDPLYTPGLAIDRDYQFTDKLVGIALPGDPNNRSVPKQVGSMTYDACIPDDPVCQEPNATTLPECIALDPACPHFHYVDNGVTDQVFQFLDQFMPSSSNWPVITSGHAPNGLVGTAYSWTPTVKPTARTTYQWSEDGVLPPDLHFSTTTGAVMGTLTKAGIYGFSVTATSTPQQRTATQFESVVINSGGPLAISPSSLPPATAGTAYKVTLSGSGGYLPYTWHATGDALSHGMQFTFINQDTSTATVSGTPDQAGTYSLSVSLTDAKGGTTTQSYSISVAPAPAPTGTDDWTQPGYDAGRSADNTGETTLGASNVGNLSQVWSSPSTSTPFVSPLEVGGNVYSVAYQQGPDGSYGDFVTARSLADGTVLWSTPLIQYSEGSELAAIVGDTIIVHEETIFGGWRNYYLAGLSLTDGTQKWSLHWSENYQVQADGNKLIAQGDGFLGTIDASSGTIEWNLGPGSGFNLHFAAGDGVIVAEFISHDASGNLLFTLEGLSEVDGSVIWKTAPTSGYSYNGVYIVAGSTLFDLPSGSMKYEARDVTTGNLLWATSQYGDNSSPGGEFYWPAASDSHTLYAPTSSSVIGPDGNSIDTTIMRAFTNGIETWHTTLPGHGDLLGVPVIANGVVYATLTDSNAGTETTFALSAATGSILWTSPSRPESLEPPVVARAHLILGPTVYALP